MITLLQLGFFENSYCFSSWGKEATQMPNLWFYHIMIIWEFIIGKIDNKNPRDIDGATPLHVAAKKKIACSAK